MFNSPKQRVLILAGIAGAATLGLILAPGATRAQEEKPAMVIGTYQPQQIAQQSGLQQKMQQEMAGLRERAQKAQQDGDQEAMQQIQTEAQQIQQNAVKDFQDSVEATLANVAKEAGVKVVAIEVAYTAPGIETKDLTSQIVEAMGGEAAPKQQVTLPNLPQGQ